MTEKLPETNSPTRDQIKALNAETKRRVAAVILGFRKSVRNARPN